MSVNEELQQIADANNGILRPVDVVEFAKDPETELHERFEWNNRKAGHEYRLWQAREIIRVAVTVLHNVGRPVRVFVSLASDRIQPGGGYRPLASVMSDAGRREELLEQAMQDFRRWQRKYKDLKALVPIFEAARSVRTKKRKAG